MISSEALLFMLLIKTGADVQKLWFGQQHVIPSTFLCLLGLNWCRLPAQSLSFVWPTWSWGRDLSGRPRPAVGLSSSHTVCAVREKNNMPVANLFPVWEKKKWMWGFDWFGFQCVSTAITCRGHVLLLCSHSCVWVNPKMRHFYNIFEIFLMCRVNESAFPAQLSSAHSTVDEPGVDGGGRCLEWDTDPLTRADGCVSFLSSWVQNIAQIIRNGSDQMPLCSFHWCGAVYLCVSMFRRGL